MSQLPLPTTPEPWAHLSRFRISPPRLLSVALTAFMTMGIVGDQRCERVPNVESLQNAYDREGASNTAGHDVNLRVVDALCNRRQQPGTYLCVVAFTDRRDPNREVYYDIAELAAEGRGWRLRSGLCKR